MTQTVAYRSYVPCVFHSNVLKITSLRLFTPFHSCLVIFWGGTGEFFVLFFSAVPSGRTRGYFQYVLVTNSAIGSDFGTDHFPLGQLQQIRLLGQGYEHSQCFQHQTARAGEAPLLACVGGLILALSCQGAHAAPMRLPQHKFHFGARRPVHSGTQDMFVGWVGGRMSGGVDGEQRDGHTNKPMMKFKTDPSTASFRELCVKVYTDSPTFGCQGHRG